MQPNAQPHPFDALTPDVVQDALNRVGLWGDGRLMGLSSYENRVYQAHLDEPVDGHTAVVLKFYRPGRWSRAEIEEEHAFAAELAQADVPVVAPLVRNGQTLHEEAGFWFSVSPRQGGRRPELDDPDVLEWIGRFLARLHTVGERRPFVHRPELNLHTFGQEPRDWLMHHAMVPLDVAGPWARTLDATLTLLGQAAPELMATAATPEISKTEANKPIQPCASANFDQEFDAHSPPHTPTHGHAPRPLQRLRLHGDCHPGNILWTPTDANGGGPHVVDLDDARSGPAIQDLWMLLTGSNRAEQTAQLGALLDGYETLRPFPRQELRLIEPLRTLRQIHYCAWLARRWSDPTFPIHFPWFGSSTYWTGQIHQLEEQTEAMQEPPLVA